MATLWIDITELFGLFRISNHPTGVSRVILSLFDTLAAEPGLRFESVRPLFWHPVRRRPLSVASNDLSPLGEFLISLKSRYAAAGIARPAPRSKVAKGLISALPKPLRFQLFPADHGVALFSQWAKQQHLELATVEFRSGDCLFVPGSFWLDRYAPALARRAKAGGAAIVAFVHDVLLLSNPEWLPGGHAEQFHRGCERFLPACTAIVCNSAHTRDSLRQHVALSSAIKTSVCRLADAPQTKPPDSTSAQLEEMRGRRIVLCVSTLLPRKNHRLLIEAWGRLWREIGEATPYLLLVGGGQPDADLSGAFERNRDAASRIMRLTNVDDGELEWLYAHAWLTVYPSFKEGYGMPVAEALARGKVCLANVDGGGIGEIAPALIDPIDPHDAAGLVEKIRFYLADPDALQRKQAAIRADYVATTWAATARCVRGALEDAVLVK